MSRLATRKFRRAAPAGIDFFRPGGVASEARLMQALSPERAGPTPQRS